MIVRDIFAVVSHGTEDEYNSAVGQVDINILDEYQHNLLHEAIAYGKKMVAIDLIDRGINVNKQDYRGQTPLHFLGDYPDIEVAEIVLQHGGRLDIVDKYGNTPLWPAVFYLKRQEDYALVRLYMKNGSDPHSKNNVGKSPIDLAETFGDEKLKAILLGKE